MSQNDITEYLAEHPKLIGTLFTAFLLLAQAGTALAGNGITHTGP